MERNSLLQWHFQFGDPLPFTELVEHEIILKSEKIVNNKSYRRPECHKNEIFTQMDDLLKKEVIRHSKSPYNSPIWVVLKKADALRKKKWQIVIDFRKINEDTDQDAYPLPMIDNITDHLGKAKFFLAFELSTGFHQIPMAKESKKYTKLFQNQKVTSSSIECPLDWKMPQPHFNEWWMEP